MSAVTATVDEAREHLRVIRQTMERSTQYSTLSGWSGILVGCVAFAGVVATWRLQLTGPSSPDSGRLPQVTGHAVLLGIWFAALIAAVTIDFVCNKRRARRVGKHVRSRLGAHIIVAALPGFLTAGVLSLFFLAHGLLPFIWGVWMLCYGAAICAVGLFSVRAVSILGAAFVLAGAATLLMPVTAGLTMMAISFGGFHILYGTTMARKHGW